MLTLRDLITDALYETSSCPVVGDLTVITTTDDTITVDIEINGAPRTTRYPDGTGGYSRMEDWADTEAHNHITFDPAADPTSTLSTITTEIIPEGADESDVEMTITLPAEMLARIVDAYLDGTPEVVMPWTPAPSLPALNPAFAQWARTVGDLIRRRTDGAWVDGLWAGVILHDALADAAVLDDQLATAGQAAAFTELCTPRLVTGDDIRASLVNHVAALTERAWTMRHHHSHAAA